MPNIKTFEDFLEEAMKGINRIEKKMIMLEKVDSEIEEMIDEISSMGEIIQCKLRVTECGCGSVKILIKYMTYKFTKNGLQISEGEFTRIIVSE